MQEAELYAATRQHMEINSKEHQSQGVQRRYWYSLGEGSLEEEAFQPAL